MSFYLFKSGGLKTTGTSVTTNDPATDSPWSADGSWYASANWSDANCYDSDGHTNVIDSIMDNLGTVFTTDDYAVIDDAIYSFSGSVFTTSGWDNTKTQEFTIASRSTDFNLCQWQGAADMNDQMIRLRRVDAADNDAYEFSITFQGIGITHLNADLTNRKDGFIFEVGYNINYVSFKECRIYYTGQQVTSSTYPIKINTDEAQTEVNLVGEDTFNGISLSINDDPQLIDDIANNVYLTGNFGIKNISIGTLSSVGSQEPLIRCEVGCNITGLVLDNIAISMNIDNSDRAGSIIAKSGSGSTTVPFVVKNMVATDVIYTCGVSGILKCGTGSYLLEDCTATNCKQVIIPGQAPGQGILMAVSGQAGREDLGYYGICRRISATNCQHSYAMLYPTFSASMRVEGLITTNCVGGTGVGVYKGGSGDLFLSGYVSINDTAGSQSCVYSHHTGGAGGRDERTVTTIISGMTVRGFSVDPAISGVEVIEKTDSRMITINGQDAVGNDHNAYIYNLSSDHDVDNDIRVNRGTVADLTLDVYNSTDNIVIHSLNSPTVTVTDSITPDGKMTSDGKLTAGSVFYKAGKMPTGVANIDARGRMRKVPPSIGGYEPTHGDISPIVKPDRGVGVYGTDLTQTFFKRSGLTGFENNGFAISFWIKMNPGSDGVLGTIIDSSSSRRVYIQRNTNNKIAVKGWNSSGSVTVNRASTGTITADGNWHHVLANATPPLLEIYIDGVSEASLGMSTYIDVEGVGDFSIGQVPTATGNTLPGSLADVWIVDQAVDPATYISAFYSSGYVDIGDDGSNVGITPKAFYNKLASFAQFGDDSSQAGANDLSEQLNYLPTKSVGPGV